MEVQKNKSEERKEFDYIICNPNPPSSLDGSPADYVFFREFASLPFKLFISGRKEEALNLLDNCPYLIGKRITPAHTLSQLR